MHLTDSSTFEILHALRVKGLAPPAVLSGLSGVAEEELPAATDPLVADGLVQVREGRLAGYLLTATGKEEAARQLAADADTAAAGPALAGFDEKFLPINTDFKEVCHRWQVTADGEPNDHGDAAYDEQVVADLGDVHAELLSELAEVATALPRFARYAPRLTDALARVRAGDQAAFARPLYDSYHDIWMELHNDVVISLGRDRGAADESTR